MPNKNLCMPTSLSFARRMVTIIATIWLGYKAWLNKAKDEPEEIEPMELEEESDVSQQERKSREWDARQKAYQDDRSFRDYP